MDKVIFDVRRKMVLDFIEEKNYKPMKFKELCMVFSVPKREKEEFKEFLDQLIAGGELTLTENGRYKKAEPDTFTGKFCGSTRGFGFVTVEGMEQDVFIPADETKGAFHGDTVLIQLVAPAVPAGGTRAAKRAEGKVLQIVERGFTEVTGIFQKNKNPVDIQSMYQLPTESPHPQHLQIDLVPIRAQRVHRLHWKTEQHALGHS